MLKVRFETITLRVPVIDNSGEHDAKMDPAVYEQIQAALEVLQAEYAPVAAAVAGKPASPARRDSSTPPSQVDPPINTRVSDREMRSSEPEMSLDEFREPPERTRAPPRPRANSWRHG